MTIWTAILLGLVQGIAEFLPISSSGHLSVLQNLFGMTTAEQGHMFFDVMLHMGTLVSIAVVYWVDIVAMVREVLIVLRGGKTAGGKPVAGGLSSARMFMLIVIATLPLFLVLPINDYLEQLYYKSAFIGIAFILTGTMLWIADRMALGTKTERNMRITDALIIGLCQCVATIPGLSRSGTTITAGIATGLNRNFAMKFAFLMSIPAVLGANLIALIKAFGTGVDISLIPAYLIGMLTAMLSGIMAIWLMKFIAKKNKFGWFAYYCWGAGVLTIILSLNF